MKHFKSLLLRDETILLAARSLIVLGIGLLASLAGIGLITGSGAALLVVLALVSYGCKEAAITACAVMAASILASLGLGLSPFWGVAAMAAILLTLHFIVELWARITVLALIAAMALAYAGVVAATNWSSPTSNATTQIVAIKWSLGIMVVLVQGLILLLLLWRAGDEKRLPVSTLRRYMIVVVASGVVTGVSPLSIHGVPYLVWVGFVVTTTFLKGAQSVGLTTNAYKLGVDRNRPVAIHDDPAVVASLADLAWGMWGMLGVLLLLHATMVIWGPL